MKQLFALILALMLGACTASEKGSNQSLFAWQLSREEVKVMSELTDTKTVTHYDGSSEVLTIKDTAAQGHVYVLIHLKINKAAAGGTAFDWDKLTLMDGDGASYHRISDDFLADHHYEVLPSINLRLGSNDGWIVFELPKKAAEKKLFLIYQADEGDNKVIVKP